MIKRSIETHSVSQWHHRLLRLSLQFQPFRIMTVSALGPSGLVSGCPLLCSSSHVSLQLPEMEEGFLPTGTIKCYTSSSPTQVSPTLLLPVCFSKIYKINNNRGRFYSCDVFVLTSSLTSTSALAFTCEAKQKHFSGRLRAVFVTCGLFRLWELD